MTGFLKFSKNSKKVKSIFLFQMHQFYLKNKINMND